MGGRPGVLGADGDRVDAGILELLAGIHQLLPGGRHLGDAGLGKQILGVPDTAGLDRGRHAVDLAVIGRRSERGGHLGLDGVTDLVGQVHELAGVNHVLILLSAKGHEHVRAGTQILHGGGQLALEVLILDGLDLDGDSLVLGLERRGEVLPVLTTITSGGVVPEHDGVVVGGRASAAAGGHAQHGSGRNTGGQNPLKLHRSS